MKTDKNKLIVSAYLAGMILFGMSLAFYFGPMVADVQRQAIEEKLLYKCQDVLSGDTIVVQLRSFDLPNTNAYINVKLMGISAPPYAGANNDALQAFAEKQGLSKEFAKELAHASAQTMRAFARKQNLMLRAPDGSPFVAPAGVTNVTAHVIVFGNDASEKQLEYGLAVRDPNSKTSTYDEVYLEAENIARDKKRGLWSGK